MSVWPLIHGCFALVYEMACRGLGQGPRAYFIISFLLFEPLVLFSYFLCVEHEKALIGGTPETSTHSGMAICVRFIFRLMRPRAFSTKLIPP